jgi:hypothetical protein
MSPKRFQKRSGFAARLILAAGVMITPSSPLYAQGPGIFSFLSPFSASLLSPSAVAYGMGGGLVAASAEASAIYYNPAALTRLGRFAVEGNTFKFFRDLGDDRRYSQVAGAFQIASSAGLWLGASYTYVNLGEQEIASETDPTRLGTFNSNERAFALAAAKKFGQHVRFGAGIKYLRGEYAPKVSNSSQKGDGSAFVYAVDLGLLYDGFLPGAHFSRQFLTAPLISQKWARKSLPPGFSFGVNLANLELKSKLGGVAVNDLVPHELRLGLAWNLFDSDVAGLMITGERAEIFLKQNENSVRADPVYRALFTAWADEKFDDSNLTFYTAGLEINLLNLGAVRFGHYWENKSGFDAGRFGFSLGPPGLRFSYATETSEFSDKKKLYTLSLVFDKLP